MSVRQRFAIWYWEARRLWPQKRVTRLRNLIWPQVGSYQSRSVHLSPRAAHIPGRATLPTLIRRLSRFLSNPAVRVWDGYRPIARSLLGRWGAKSASSPKEPKLHRPSTADGRHRFP